VVHPIEQKELLLKLLFPWRDDIGEGISFAEFDEFGVVG
jgi:hypothetical protein